MCFDSWKDEEFDLIGCSIEQFRSSNAFLKLAEEKLYGKLAKA